MHMTQTAATTAEGCFRSLLCRAVLDGVPSVTILSFVSVCLFICFCLFCCVFDLVNRVMFWSLVLFMFTIVSIVFSFSFSLSLYHPLTISLSLVLFDQLSLFVSSLPSKKKQKNIRQADKQTHGQRDRLTDAQADRQTGKQTSRYTDGQTTENIKYVFTLYMKERTFEKHTSPIFIWPKSKVR